MWRVFALLFIVFPFSVFAECVSVDTVTKCARLPEFWMSRAEAGEYASSSWSIIYGGVVYSGNSAECSKEDFFYSCQCVVNSPFNAAVQFSAGAMSFGTAYEACSNMQDGEMLESFTFDSKLEGDACPDGFYTVPYEVSCGEGMVDVADVPYCDDDMSGDYCLMLASAEPCAAGITTLRTGAGVIVPLWAEKATEPSLCVKYNDTVCYGNLEAGRAVGAINVNYNGVVYHMVD